MNHIDLTPFIERVKQIPMIGVAVRQNGEEIARYQWESEIRLNIYSASKSFTSAAVGIAIGEGLFSSDDFVLSFFPEQAPTFPCTELAQLQVKHLLSMSVGQTSSFLMGPQRYHIEDDWVKACLSQPFSHQPGEQFLYSNTGPYLAGMIVQKLTNKNLVDYLMPRLFSPLEIKLPTWEVDPLGNTFGAGGLFLSLTEFSKFAELYLQQGEWKGKQLIPSEWVSASSQLQVKTGIPQHDQQEYGYLFWRGEHGSYRADGKYGQYAIILPEKNAVIAINAFNRGEGDILQAVWDTIYPQL